MLNQQNSSDNGNHHSTLREGVVILTCPAILMPKIALKTSWLRGHALVLACCSKHLMLRRKESSVITSHCRLTRLIFSARMMVLLFC